MPVRGVRALCRSRAADPDVVRYDPSAPLHQRYLRRTRTSSRPEDQSSLLEDITLTVNGFFGWDFNSCELAPEGRGLGTRSTSPTLAPTAQVTSLQHPLPVARAGEPASWGIFCAATQARRCAPNLDWSDVLQAVRDQEAASIARRIAAYAAITRERMEVDALRGPSAAEHLARPRSRSPTSTSATDRARVGRYAQKVEALFPEHEWDEFTDLFFQSLQDWRDWDASRRGTAARSSR